ncbi:MAG: hypothetical protein OXE95_06780 [Chloroflexi bacterium]|nr:hypothetical protein [Chloroflexota bacterium]MCY4247264.1 hypothetical protein [Chloroflexota bacterium]
MTLSPQLDQKIRQRFDGLITETSELISKMEAHNEEYKHLNPDYIGSNYGHVSEFRAVVEKVLNLIVTVLGESRQQNEVTERIRQLAHRSRAPFVLEDMRGTLQGIKDIYENGFLDDLETRVAANISADYMTQVEGLLDKQQSGQNGYIPAAMLCGAVLEGALRRLCARQTPPVPTEKLNGKNKLLNALIQDLQKANAYNKLKANQLRTWASVRNSANHGNFGEFDRKQVEEMVAE